MTTDEFEIEIAAPTDYVYEWYRNTFENLGQISSEPSPTDGGESARTISVSAGERSSSGVQFAFTETDAGTRVHVHRDTEAGTSLLSRAIQPVVTHYSNRQFPRQLHAMKEQIEAEYEGDASHR